jgi:outer membrane protein assembly factor BamA
MFGGDVDFFRFNLDLRYYITIVKRQILALNEILNHTSGDVSIQMMLKLGNYKMMRGYAQGKYTDKNLWAAQAEYRVPIFWKIGLPPLRKLVWLLLKFQDLILRFDTAYGTEGFYISMFVDHAF